MSHGSWIQNLDVAALSIWLFWFFFAGLVFYLQRESKREGYPLVSDRSDRVLVQGFPAMPPPKTFLLPHGGQATVPKPPVHAPFLAEPVAKFPGAPLAPVGDPMQARVGPGAYALRHDGPDLMFEDSTPKIVPLRTAPDFSISPDDPDPRGFKVLGADGKVGGVCVDLWIDKADMLFRYLEVETTLEDGTSRRMMVPMPLLRVDENRKVVLVKGLLGKHFATAPVLAKSDIITLTEEEAVQAYVAAGHLYATRDRSEPLL